MVSRVAALLVLSMSGLESGSRAATNSVPARQSYAVFCESSVNSIKPQGWMLHLLETQRDGLTGHMQVAGDPFDKDGWGAPAEKIMDQWAQYEQCGYWADGALRCGYLIGDEALKQKVKGWIEYQITHPDENGFIGPKNISFLWPEVVFFRAMMAEYAATKDDRILQALKKNYHAPQYETFSSGDGDFFKDRLILHIEIMCWLYAQTGDRFFLEKSEKAYREFNEAQGQYSLSAMKSDSVPHSHAVSYSENLKIPVILYMYTGRKEYLDAALNAVRKVYKYHGLIDGLPSGNELHDGHFSNEVHETCTASDMQWALGYLLQATGDPKWADLIEQICFNAGLGSVAKDFRSYQYYSGPNQVTADGLSSHWNDHEDWYMFSRDRASYKIDHRPSCCGGNMNRILPVFCSRMWMTKGADGIVAALYTPSAFHTVLHDGQHAVTVKEETHYPFDERIHFIVEPAEPTTFSLWLRIPTWCSNAEILINGVGSKIDCQSGTFVEVRRTFHKGDQVALRLPMEVKKMPLPENGIAFQRGPLVYSLPVEAETTVTDTRTADGITFCSSHKKPISQWNLAPLDEDGIQVVESCDYTHPWDPGHSPVKLIMQAVTVKNWGLYRDVYTPVLPGILDLGERKTIELVPLGSTELRLTIFPDLLKRYSR
ncbi:MAG: glycoside hydrolase family 127 protein [Pontiellaceae bacterium]|nr:glycoside hydrolase family 127 protein [Pontiellaceae bacterium]MBN2785846.1 glycoside hydrolase family 127 protein [Pontiellaceae bacterium]